MNVNTINQNKTTSFGLKLDRKTAKLYTGYMVEGNDIVNDLLKDRKTNQYTARLLTSKNPQKPSVGLYVISGQNEALLQEFPLSTGFTASGTCLIEVIDFLEKHVREKTFSEIAEKALNETKNVTINLPSNSGILEKICSPIRTLLSKLGIGK